MPWANWNFANVFSLQLFRYVLRLLHVDCKQAFNISSWLSTFSFWHTDWTVECVDIFICSYYQKCSAFRRCQTCTQNLNTLLLNFYFDVSFKSYSLDFADTFSCLIVKSNTLHAVLTSYRPNTKSPSPAILLVNILFPLDSLDNLNDKQRVFVWYYDLFLLTIYAYK